MEVAIHRRLEQELGLSAHLEYVYKFEYTAPFGDVGTEHELCWVYVGTTDAEPLVNTTEVANWRWIAPSALDEELAATPQRFTPWFKLEWQALRDTHRKRLRRLSPRALSHERNTRFAAILPSPDGPPAR